MAKALVGHFVEAQILETIGVDYIDESEALAVAEDCHFVNNHTFRAAFVWEIISMFGFWDCYDEEEELVDLEEPNTFSLPSPLPQWPKGANFKKWCLLQFRIKIAATDDNRKVYKICLGAARSYIESKISNTASSSQIIFTGCFVFVRNGLLKKGHFF